MPKAAATNSKLIDKIQLLEDLSQTAISKLSKLEQEITELKRELRAPSSKIQSPIAVHFYFDRSTLDRKPFSLSISGPLQGKIGLSAVRTAILLVLLIDLQDRLEGGQGIADPQSTACAVLPRIQSASESVSGLEERVRVAFYRFEQFLIESAIFKSKTCRLSYDSETVRLRLQPDGASNSPAVSCGDKLLSEIADELFTTSPLLRLRRSKSLYVPPGPKGMDRLLLEFYEQPEQLTVRSMYFRPAQVNWPRELLERTGASNWLLRRNDLALEMLANGQARFIEILHEDSLWNLIRTDSSGRFVSYPAPVTKHDVTSHLDHLIWRIKNLAGYEMFITGVIPPMYLVTYEIGSKREPGAPTPPGEYSTEYFTASFQPVKAVSQFEDVATYMINDPIVFKALSENVIDNVLRHPTTIVKPNLNISKLSEIRDRLINNGPLVEHNSVKK